MNLLVISINYPTEKRHVHVFLDNLVKQFADRGVHIDVISPQSSFSYYKRPDDRRELVSKRKTENGNEYTVYSPLFTIFPKKKFGSFSFEDKSKKSFLKSLEKTVRKYNITPDAVYSHFFQAGVPAVMLARKLGVPSFIANGEADTIGEISQISKKYIDFTLKNVTGIISVSTKCKDEVAVLCSGDENIMKKVHIVPNGADTKKFYPLDKKECRKQLGFPENDFILSFVGSFIERKGVDKVRRVTDKTGSKGIFIGTGEMKPIGDNVLHSGRVKNEDIPKYLCASDVFVLPTLAEGCCNAIVEAICCGLPVISSDRSFNFDILDETNGILINPENEQELEKAVLELKNNPEKCSLLSKGSAEKSKELDLERRAEKILDIIGTR